MRPRLPRPSCARPAAQSRYAMPAAARTAWAAAPPPLPPLQTLSSSRTGLRRLTANQDRDRLRRRCAALHIMVGKREQRICLRVIGADRAGRDVMGLGPKTVDHAALVIGQGFDFDRIALRNAAGAHV